LLKVHVTMFLLSCQVILVAFLLGYFFVTFHVAMFLFLHCKVKKNRMLWSWNLRIVCCGGFLILGRNYA